MATHGQWKIATPPQGTPFLAPREGSKIGQPKNTILAEAGRAPWYDSTGCPVEAYIVGVAGGSASGKTSVASAILSKLPGVQWVAIVSQDSFYKSLTPEQSKLAFENDYDFDHPAAFDAELFRSCVEDLRRSRAVELPEYSFVQHQRVEGTQKLYGATVVIVEGIFVLHDPELRKLLDLKIYVQADSDLMLARRIKRDVTERGRDVEGILAQYLRFVKPSMDNFVSQTAKWADLIVPGANNSVAIEVVSQHIHRQLQVRAHNHRTQLSEMLSTPSIGASASQLMAAGIGRSQALLGSTPDVLLPPSVNMLRQTPQLKGLLTILHDCTTPAADFIFYTNRVAKLVVEEGMGMLPFVPKRVTLQTNGREHTGSAIATDKVCSVSILRGGAVLENSLRRAIPDIPLGSLLIQSSEDTGEPRLYTVSLPSFLRSRKTAAESWVFLLDAQIGSGAAAFMGLRVLLDHGVPESNIVLLTLLASAKGGLHAIHAAFPAVRVVVAGVDPGLTKMRIPHGVQVRESAHVDGPAAPKRQLSGSERGSNSQSISRRTSVAKALMSRPATLHPTDFAKDKAADLPGGSPSRWNIDGPTSPDSVRLDPLSLNATMEDSLDSPNQDRVRTRVVFAIRPGCGSIGDRYFGT